MRLYNKTSKKLALGLCTLCLGTVLSTHALGESLNDAVSYALTTHPSIEAARAILEASEEKVNEERSAYFPTISTTATGGRIFGDNATSRGLSVTRGSGYSYLWEGSATARQKLFDGFKTINLVESSKSRRKAADMGIDEVRENLALRTVQGYIDVLRTRKTYSLFQEHRKKIEDYLERIKTSVDEGASDEAEYQQAREVQALLENYIADYTGQIRIAEANYEEVTGKKPDQDLTPVSSIAKALPESKEAALSYAKDNHPSVRAAYYRSQASKSDIDAEQGRLYPDLNAELSYLKSDKEDIIGGEVEDAKAVLRMKWEFDTGGAQFARINQKELSHKESMARLHEIQRQIEHDVNLAYAELQTAREMEENQKKRVDLNATLLETNKIQFEGARISLLQLMQSENQNFITKLEQVNTEYRIYAAEYAVLASTGILQDSLTMTSATTIPDSQDQSVKGTVLTKQYNRPLKVKE